MQLQLVRWFIYYFSAVTLAWSYYGLFVDWLLDKYYKQEDELLWYFCLFIVMVLGLMVAVSEYRA